MSKYLPISYVENRRKNISDYKCSGIYPLYKSYDKIYNSQNLLEAIKYWYNKSPNLSESLKSVFSILDIMESNNDYDSFKKACLLIESNVFPYLKNAAIIKNEILKKIELLDENSKIKQYYQYLLESSNNIIECDRVLSNFNNISKRYNIEKFVNDHIIYEDAIQEAIYGIAELIDTYNMNMKDKFCVTCECALLLTNNSISSKTVLEGIIDYYLYNYSNGKNVESLLESINNGVEKDPFIPKGYASEYTKYISFVNQKLTESYSTENFINSLYTDPNKLLEDNSLNMINTNNAFSSLYEIAILDNAKEWMTKIKLMPSRTVAMLKQAIMSLLVIHRLEDVKQSTHNVLAMLFYTFITLSAFSMGLLPGIFAFVTSISRAKMIQKEYYKMSLEEWREHRYSVQRKIDESTDSEKKNKLQKYLYEVDKNIDIIEKEYEKLRDKTSSEIKEKVDNKINNQSYSGSDVSPTGKSLFDKSDDDSSKSDSSSVSKNDQSINSQSNDEDSDDDDSAYYAYLDKRDKYKY